MTFSLTSTAFLNGATVPAQCTCTGADRSPPLVWRDPPAGTQSFALIMDDPDATAGTWVHWVIYDLPSSMAELAEGQPTQATLPNGAKQGMAWGVKEFQRVGYGGPCPPPGKPHRYIFTLYALDRLLNLTPSSVTALTLRAAMKSHVLDQAQLTGLYGR